MKKVIEFFKSPLFLPVAILMIPYTYWLFFIPSKTFLRNFDLKLGMLSLTIFFVVTVLGKILINNNHLYFLPYIFVIPVSLAAIQFGQLYLFSMFIFDFYRTRPVFLFLAGIILVIVITYKKLPKPDKRQLIFFLSTLPIFAFSMFNFIVYCPAIWATEDFGGYRYYVVEEIWDYPHSDVDFYKCRKLSFQCEILDGIQSGHPEIIIDDEKKRSALCLQTPIN